MSAHTRSAEERSGGRRRRAWPWLIAALLWFLPLDTPHLFDPDEGRYAEVPREMVASGDWVTPRLDGIKYFEKPALQYWTTAVAFELLGERAWTVRLWPALCGFLGLLLTFAVGRRLYGERAAAFSAIVQGGALLYVGMARIATLDMGLTFTLQLAMSALVLLVRPPAVASAVARPVGAAPATSAGAAPRPLPSWQLPLLLGVGVALAVLTKGLVGILIPSAVALLFMLMYRDWRLALAAQPWWTLAALLVLAAPWFILVSARNPEFARFFFLFEHIQRYLNRAGFDRYQPVWFFVPVLLLGFLPWTTLLPRSLIEAVRAARGAERASALLLIWAAFVFVFFSLSQSKLVPYVLPMIPALSLLTGRSLARLTAARLAAHLTAVAIGAALIVLLLLSLWPLPLAASLVERASTPSIVLFASAFALLALGAALGVYWCRRGHLIAAAASAGLGALLLTQCSLLAAEQLPRMRALVQLELRLRPWMHPSTHFYCVDTYPQPLPFYVRHTCTLVGYRGELDFGLRQESALALADLPQFLDRWRAQSEALAIMTPEDYRRLEALGAPMHVIYTAPSLVAVAR